MSEISPEEKKIRDGLRSPLIEALNNEGITLPYLTKHLKKELIATQVKPFLGPKGEILYTKDMDALEIQQKARVDAHKLRGDYPSDKLDITGSVQIDRSPEEQALLRSVAKEIAQKIRK